MSWFILFLVNQGYINVASESKVITHGLVHNVHVVSMELVVVRCRWPETKGGQICRQLKNVSGLEQQSYNQQMTG